MAKPNTRSIKLYTLSTCPLCKWLKKKLKEMGHKFEAVDVDLLKSGEQWIATKEVKRCNPEATYPTMIVEEVVLDFSDDNLNKTLGNNMEEEDDS